MSNKERIQYLNILHWLNFEARRKQEQKQSSEACEEEKANLNGIKPPAGM